VRGRQDTTRPRREPFPIVTSAAGVLGAAALVTSVSHLAAGDTPEADGADPRAPAPAEATPPDGPGRVEDRTLSGVRVVRAAAEEYGHPYRYGADGPVAFDCSGLTQHVFAQFGVRLPHNSAAQYRAVDHVPRSDMRLGDLVFVYDDDGIYHVGVYAGGDRMWAASNPGEVVRTHEIWTDRYVVGRP
jgi:cell wall-associated NlpC family hydrolase